MAHKAIRLEVDEFVAHFLKAPGPSSTDTPPTLSFNPFKDIANAAEMLESTISALFVEAVNKHDLAPGLKMALSEKCADKGDSEGQKIDAAFFRPGLVPTDGRPHWRDQMVPVEFKAHDVANDPYDDRQPGTVDAYAQTRKQVRGQIIHYAEKIFEYQHRTSLIFLIVIGRRFRLSRWDRSGTLVTRAVDYVEHPQILCEALWYMGRLSDKALGLDPTAHRVLPGSAEHARMLRASVAPDETPDLEHQEASLDALPAADAVFAYVRAMFKDSLDVNFPWYRLEVPHEGRMHSFLVGKRVFCAPGMAGRGTRGFVALDAEASPVRFVWLKDAWRTNYMFVAKEGDVLQELNRAEVPYVPTLVCHGDLPGQDTETPTWWERKNPLSTLHPTVPSLAPPALSSGSSSRTLVNLPSRSSHSAKRSAFEMEDSEGGNRRDDCPLRRHKHYRIVVKEVGMKLVNFQDGQQLLQIIADCICAHAEAVTKANIMHRDISGGNILILPKAVVDSDDPKPISLRWTGLLVDWELSKPLKGEAGEPRPRQPERTGTWHFMSAAVLNNHGKLLEISDELESFFHVTLYYAVRYLRSNCTNVGGFIEDYFDTYTVENGMYRCGWQKSSTVSGGVLRVDTDGTPLRFGSRLDKFFEKALQWFKAHYAVQTYQRAQASKATAKTPDLDPKQSQPIRRKISGWGKYQRLSETADADSDSDEHMSPSAEELLPPPSAAHVKDAAKLTTHDSMLRHLVKMIRVQEWPRDRVSGDNVPKNYVPKNPIGPPPITFAPSNKRARTEALEHGLAFASVGCAFFSEPPRTPPRRGTIV